MSNDDDLERRLRDLFSADARSRGVSGVRRSPSGPLSLAVTAAGVAATILLALWIGAALGERRAAAPPTPTPTGTRPGVVTSPTPSPVTATSTPSPGPAREYGYVFTVQPVQPCTSGCRIVVRREDDGSTIFELDGVLPAVSPDGRQLAYWRTTPDVGPTDLRVLDITDLRSDRSVFTVSAQTVGGPVVWAAGYPGLLVITESVERSGGAGGSHCPVSSTLVTVDLTVTPPTTRSAAGRPSACVHIPLAWDPHNSFAAVIGMGPGGYATEYLVWDPRSSVVSSAQIPPGLLLAGSARASTDGLEVAALEDSLTVVRVWPTRDITKAERYTQAARVAGLFWRPAFVDYYEILWSTGQRIEALRHPPGTVSPLFTTAAGAVAIRPDGSGLLLAEGTGPSAGVPSTKLIVLDLATRQTAEMMIISGPFGASHAVISRGVILR
jgi:hypothetical protein